MFVVRQRSRGFSSGAIGDALVDKCGYTLDARDIGRLVIEDRKAKTGVEKKEGERRTSLELECELLLLLLPLLQVLRSEHLPHRDKLPVHGDTTEWTYAIASSFHLLSNTIPQSFPEINHSLILAFICPLKCAFTFPSILPLKCPFSSPLVLPLISPL